MTVSEKIFRANIKRGNDLMYYVKNGDVWAVPRRKPGEPKGKAFIVARAGIKMDYSRYLYFLDADGDIARKEREAGGGKRERGTPVKATAPAKKATGSRYRRPDESQTVSERNPFEVDPEKIERGNRGHCVTQNALADFLVAHGIDPKSPEAGDPEFDVAWPADAVTHVAEVKSLTDSNEEKQLRLGLGQVLRYRHLLAQRGGHVTAVLVAEREPRDRTWVSTCADLGVALVWPAVFEQLR